MIITDHREFKEGMTVKLLSEAGEHTYWGYRVGETYHVIAQPDPLGASDYGPVNEHGFVPWLNWDKWHWEVV